MVDTDIKLTPAWRRELERSMSSRPIPGLLTFNGPAGLARSGWDRMMRRMAAQGLVTEYVHGGYEITEKGRIAAGLPPSGS
jgi:hypothetical protein